MHAALTSSALSKIAVTADGSRALVLNRYNDSVSVLNLASRSVISEQDLRPGKSGGVSGSPGGEYPNSVAIAGTRTAYVSSERDREIVVLDIGVRLHRLRRAYPSPETPTR